MITKEGFLGNLGFENLNSKPTTKSLNEFQEDSSRSVLTCLEVIGGKIAI